MSLPPPARIHSADPNLDNILLTITCFRMASQIADAVTTSAPRRGATILGGALAVLTAALVAISGRTVHAGTLSGSMVLTLDNISRYTAPGGTTVSLYNQTSGGNPVADGHGDVDQGGAFLWSVDKGSAYSGNTFDNPNVNTPSVNDPSHVLTFCIEINQNINWGGTYTYQLVSLKDGPQAAGSTEIPVTAPANHNSPDSNDPTAQGMGARGAFLIEQLWQKHFDSIFSPSPGANSLLSTNHNVLAGAFQLAIWKLEYDANDASLTYSNGGVTNADFTSGYLRVDGLKKDFSNASAIVQQAEKWLDGLSLNYTGPLADLYALTNPGAQDQLVEDPPAPAPEPASVAIWLAIGIAAGLSKVARRRCFSARS